MRQAARLLALAWLLAGVQPASATTVYVTDRIELGLHADRAVTAPVILLVPSGTALEMLERDGPLVRVRTDEGIEGWVDSAYVSDTQPVSARLMAVTATNEALRAELGTLRNEVDRLKADLIDSEENRKRQIAVLARKAEVEAQAREAEIDALRAAAGASGEASDAVASELERLQTELARLRRSATSTAASTIPSDTLREMQRLAEENQALKARVTAAGAPPPPDAQPAAPPWPSAGATDPGETVTLVQLLRALSPYDQALLGFGALLLFSLGLAWQDYLVRRRHGGYRV